MRRVVKPSFVSSPTSQCPAITDSEDESLDDHLSITSVEDVRVQPILPLEPRKDGSVRVAVRIRPLLPRELARNALTCVYKAKEASNAIVVSDGIERTFTFDHVFPQSTSQTELYNEALNPWMASFLQGFNVTVIAYGQTGSGKTHTMGNHMPSLIRNNLFVNSPSLTDNHEDPADVLDRDEGLIPRFLYQLFTKLKDSGSTYQLSVSFLEIYGENIHDLLENASDKRRSEPLQMRENKKNGVWVQGLTEVWVSTRQEALELMRRGSLQRITASTQMNERSSRSHAVYTVKIVQRVSKQKRRENVCNSTRQRSEKALNRDLIHGEDAETEADAVIVSKLTFVDLAGSERLKKTRAEGERMKEGIQINVGLFALGNVINALGDDKHRSALHIHVPYRSSKLTRLLQDALGGNSRTLFIACVSPADYNTNETLNTLQYANRAKNIQNKAVKNIDSRSADVVNLRAFNQILSRELVKAIIGEHGVSHVDPRTEACMTNPKVVAYLKKIEQLSATAGQEASSDEYFFKMQRLVHRLTTYLHELVPCKGYLRTPSLTSSNEDRDDDTQPHDESMDFISDSGSSIAILEDRIPDSEEALVTLYPLGKLCRTLEIMNSALEMQDILRIGKQKNDVYRVRITNVETRYHRHELLRNGLIGTIERMRTWLTAHATEALNTRLTIDCSLEEALRKLELMDIEMVDIQLQKDRLIREQEVQITRCQREWKAKQAQIERMREMPEETIENALNVMTRRTEIKVRFDSYDLNSIAEYLKEEEKEMAAFIDEDDAALSLISPLFPKEELSLSYTRKIWPMIQDQLRIALDMEALEASMSKELRKRTQCIQNITSGLKACNCGEMTEQEFMEKNEEKLKNCEDCISQIRDAMHAKQNQRASLSELLDSIKSLDAAKIVIKRLIVENYSQRRTAMACDEEDGMRRQREAEEIAKQRLETIKIAMDKKVEDIEAKYAVDAQCAFQMVSSFNDAVRSGMHIEKPVEAQKACDVAAINERERALLAEKEEQLATMRADLNHFQASAKIVEMKEESFRLMRKCQEIWKELGVDENDQTSKLDDINKLLLNKCSEELEGLLATRAKLQARINDTHQVVYRLESILNVDDRVKIHSLSSVAGTTLLEQENYLLSRQKRLSHDFWQRLRACIQISEGIRGLVADLQVGTIEDFCHVSNNDVGICNAEVFQSIFSELTAWKHFNENKDDAKTLEKVLESLGDGASISNLSRQRNELLFNALLTEKTKRIVELEQSLEAIRTVAQNAHLSQSDIEFVINALHHDDGEEAKVDASGKNVSQELCAWILQMGGHLDVSKKALENIATVLRAFKEIKAGRSAALEFFYRTREEAVMLLHDIHVGDGVDNDASRHQIMFSLHHSTDNLQRNGNLTDTLAAGKEMLIGLREPVEILLRRMLVSTNDAFAAFGIDTEEHQLSFFLGSKDEGQVARRAILEKYAVRSPSVDTALDNSEKKFKEHYKDSFLSKLDPAFDKFCWVYSISFGDLQLQRLRVSITDIDEVQRTVKSTQKRLESLQKIMKIFTKINEFKAKIAKFETSASQKERLFGNSLRLLEEERFRKMAAKHYPSLLESLRKEVTRWLKNEDGEFDLRVLGEDLRRLLLDMMNTNTCLMHLDLSTGRRSAKQILTPSLSSSNLQTASSGRAATPARARTQSAHTSTLEI